MKKRLISMLLIVAMTIAVLSINAFAVCTEYSVGMHGTRGKPAGASDSTENWYYSYYSNQSYWVGANYKSTGKQVYMVQPIYLLMESLQTYPALTEYGAKIQIHKSVRISLNTLVTD